jgi:aerobic carbon-monoxide dehydrogenase large subunit
LLHDQLVLNPATADEIQPRYVGKRIRLREALPLVKGEGTFVDDVRLPVKTYWVAFLRSPYAHAKITRIDTRQALSNSSVKAVFTGNDFKDIKLGYWSRPKGSREPERHLLALDNVKFHGEPVAAVIADNKYSAEDALDEIHIDFEPLQALVDPLRSLTELQIKVHDDLPDNVLYREEYESSHGALERIREAPVIVEEAFKNGRTSPIPLEPKSHLAWYDGKKLQIWGTVQNPHNLRVYISETFNIPDQKIRIVTPNVGGGFGANDTVGVAMALYAIALKTKLPVKWIETRTEHILTSGHERDQSHFIQAGFSKDGRLIGIHDRIVADVGVGGQWRDEFRMIPAAMRSLPGTYSFRDYVYDMNVVCTNKAPVSPNVGYGVPVATFVMERIMDIAASRLSLDPVEIRKINLVKSNEFPFCNAAGTIYDSGHYEESLNLLLRIMDYGKLRSLQRSLREQNISMGIGVAFYIKGNSWSSISYNSAGAEVGGYEKAVVRVTPTGKVTVAIGVADQGQGHKTIFAQIAADKLGANMNDVEIVEGDTDLTPFGFGAHADRSTVVVGNAIMIASDRMKRKLKRIAAHLLGTNPEEITIFDSSAFVSNNPSKRLLFSDLAKVAYRLPTKLPPGEMPQLEETAIFDGPSSPSTISYGCHAAIVQVDSETGHVSLQNYYVVDDAGVIINPLTADAQIHGGVVSQGILQTFNELIYNEQGILMTSSFMDYCPPVASEGPVNFLIGHTVSPGPLPGKMKGLGEGGAVGSPAAYAAAVADAISPFGGKLTKIPLNENIVYSLLNQ